MSLLKQSSTNTSSVNVGNFQNAENGVKDYFKKKKGGCEQVHYPHEGKKTGK